MRTVRRAHGSESWGLWGLFGVLVVAVFASWLAGRPVGAIAFVALLLTYQESSGYIWLWANLLAAFALARAAPEGRLRRVARVYRGISFVVLGIALLPLLVHQARVALHPQVDGGFFAAGLGEGFARDRRFMEQPAAATALEEGAPTADAVAPAAEAPAPPAIALPDEQNIRVEQEAGRIVGKISSGLNSAQVVQRYAPGTLLQTGPGIPTWRYVVYNFAWSGPVEADQSVRFLYLGPLLLGIWRIVG